MVVVDDLRKVVHDPRRVVRAAKSGTPSADGVAFRLTV
eukprot:CAMPEP_0171073450 /NCGR_PEP_ID=MMETSP0766_2-20121228/11522_1 /TAXON_ID=439317 /ORGANISM="Gambierdiscus australes, Strain CAWD 149" /LENGTH=37 /DNA_ID= /DNA_START= /DNA_END= /DNA_ORIENTATION=